MKTASRLRLPLPATVPSLSEFTSSVWRLDREPLMVWRAPFGNSTWLNATVILPGVRRPERVTAETRPQILLPTGITSTPLPPP